MNKKELKFLLKNSPHLRRYMNKYGVDPNVKDEVGTTALMENGKILITSRLLKNGWDINAQDIYGHSAIDHAIDVGGWKIAKLLLQYNLEEKILISALYNCLRVNFGCRKVVWDQIILQIIEKLGGITPEKCPDALLFAFGGRFIPYISCFIAAGFVFKEEKLLEYYDYDYDGQAKIYEKFMKNKNFSFHNCSNYPLYIENGVLHARPELYTKVWPPLPRKKKKFLFSKPNLHTMNFIANWTTRLSPEG